MNNKEPGYVYTLTNSSFHESWVKIGKSRIKRFFLLTAALLTIMTADAQQIREQDAFVKAQQFFAKTGRTHATRGTVKYKAPELVLANNSDEYYVFNDIANGGYVVISGDERMPDVLAYSYDGFFDTDNLPCNMRAWMEGYAEQVKYLRAHPEAKATRRTATERENIAPLLTCAFNQGKYYNNKCPVVDGEHCVTGCVATAMAQIMHYYQWPKQTTDVIPTYTTANDQRIYMPDIPITTIDWDNILNRYYSKENNYSEKQIDAISTLMLLCGASVKMQYSPKESGAYVSDAAKAFVRYFDYSDMIEYVERSECNIDEWEQIIYEELYNRRPVGYSGTIDLGDHFSGHAFVVDGYENGYFHINWGWGGTESYAIIGDNGGLTGHVGDDEAIVGINPAKAEYPSRYGVLDNGKMTLYYDKEKANRSGVVLKKDEWPKYAENITECDIDPSFANLKPKDLSGFFKGFKIIKSIKGIEYLNTSLVYNMSSMFSGCSSLTNLDLSSFKTDNITDMEYMFSGCSALTTLDLSGFKTDNVTDMGSMFSGCSSLTSLDLSRFNTEHVKDMGRMFSGCSSITNLDLSNFKPKYLRSISGMFKNCSSLTSIDLSCFNDIIGLTYMNELFSGCSSLTSLDLSGLNTDRVEEMNSMFKDCSSLTTLDLSGFNTDQVMKMESMFKGCSSLTSLDINGFNTDKVYSMRSMFEGCSSLTSLDLSGFNTDRIKDMFCMFAECSSLTSLDLSSFNTENTTNMERLFFGCSSLTNLDLSSFKTDNVTNMGGMFFECSSLTSLDLSSFKTDNVTNMGGMFGYCSNLTKIDLSNFKTDKVMSMSEMFDNCSNLTKLDLSGFITDNVTEMEYMFEGCSSLTSIDMSGFNTNNVTRMDYMFNDCFSLTSIDLSDFNTVNVTNMEYMFNNCPELSSIYASKKWDMSNVKYSNRMFYGCHKIVGGAGTTYDSRYTNGKYARIDEGPSNPGYLTYKDPLGIAKLQVEQDTQSIYMLNGIKLDKPQKGLNIVVMGDGAVRKVVMK
ncbi:MAG: BspA family leucine-rich repeat surface protein [Prevotella sp.]|nr:BspA family leucine-rich repeat surface protein [Prevotella sp.]